MALLDNIRAWLRRNPRVPVSAQCQESPAPFFAPMGPEALPQDEEAKHIIGPPETRHIRGPEQTKRKSSSSSHGSNSPSDAKRRRGVPVNNCLEDTYIEWAPNATEDTNLYWYGDGLTDDQCVLYCRYDLPGNPPTPPAPKKVKAPSGPPPVRPPSAPPVNPPGAPRIRRPKAPPLPY